MPIGVNLTLMGRLKPQLQKQNPPARVAQPLIFHQSATADFVYIAANSIRQGLNWHRWALPWLYEPEDFRVGARYYRALKNCIDTN